MSNIRSKISTRHVVTSGNFGHISSENIEFMSISTVHKALRPSQSSEGLQLGTGSYVNCAIHNMDLIATTKKGELIHFRLDR